MLIEVWVISIIILITTYIVRSGDIKTETIIKCLFPTTFANNWYLTCYLLFYPIHTILNKIINDMSKTQLFRSVAALSVLYIGINFIVGGLFFSSELILWITIYFLMAYIKIYLPDMNSNKKANIILLCIGIIGNIAIVILTNFLGFKTEFLSDGLWHWVNNCNPFIILSTIALLNLARSAKLKNRFINHISSLSLLIYIIHENLILRLYYRPLLINYVYENFGYKHIILWVLLLSAAIFVGSAIISFVYEQTLKKLVNKLSQVVCNMCTNIWRKLEIFALKLH